jgi:hypothetical protein
VRTLALICGSLFIIPSPWLLNWYVKWVVESFTMTRTAAPAIAEAA